MAGMTEIRKNDGTNKSIVCENKDTQAHSRRRHSQRYRQRDGEIETEGESEAQSATGVRLVNHI